MTRDHNGLLCIPMSRDSVASIARLLDLLHDYLDAEMLADYDAEVADRIQSDRRDARLLTEVARRACRDQETRDRLDETLHSARVSGLAQDRDGSVAMAAAERLLSRDYTDRERFDAIRCVLDLCLASKRDREADAAAGETSHA